MTAPTATPPADSAEPTRPTERAARDTVTDASLHGARAWFAEKGLSRPREGRVLAGVSAAFSRRFGVNRLVARLATITVAIVFTPLVYVAFWILLPRDA